MTLTTQSFDDLKAYKKDLQKTLRTCLKSKYTLIEHTIGGKKHDLVVCGKNHDDLMEALKQKGNVKTPGKGEYEAGTFHPKGGQPITGELLETLGVADIATVDSKKLADNETIPGSEVTYGDFKQEIAKARKLLVDIPNEKMREMIQRRLSPAVEKLLKIDQQQFDDVTLPYSNLQQANDQGEMWVDVAKDLVHWLPIAQKQTPKAVEKLNLSRQLLDRGQPESAKRVFGEGMEFFKKGPTNLEAPENEHLNDPVKNKVGELATARAALGDLYFKGKTSMIDAIKLNAGDSKMLLHKEAKVLSKVLPALFKNDLKDKLDAVDLAKDETLKGRKPLIEKALIAVRQYLKGAEEIKTKADINGDLMLVFVRVLEQIQKTLLEDYRSKPMPEQK